MIPAVLEYRCMVTSSGAEHVQRRTAFAVLDPVNLQPFAHRGLEAHILFDRQCRTL